VSSAWAGESRPTYLGEDNMNLQTMVIIEKVMFNLLMYAIMFIGGSATIVLNMSARSDNPVLHKDVLFVSAATFFGAGLCHFFHHLSASYLALKGSDDIKAYEADRKKHRYVTVFVGYANAGYILIVLGYVYNSLEHVYQDGTDFWTLGALANISALAMFVLAPEIAARGWKSKFAIRPKSNRV
jgi:hypothetical protein